MLRKAMIALMVAASVGILAPDVASARGGFGGGGGEATLAELPAPLGSLPELLRPPALAGPDGAPLTPAVPAPAEPAFGEPAALALPADGPLAAPPALPPPPPPL